MSATLISLGLCGCNQRNCHDTVWIDNKISGKVDDICIRTPEGYFFDRNESFRIDDNTVCITIYFSNLLGTDTYWEE